MLGSTDEMVRVKNDEGVFSSEGNDVFVQFQMLAMISHYQVSGYYCHHMSLVSGTMPPVSAVLTTPLRHLDWKTLCISRSR